MRRVANRVNGGAGVGAKRAKGRHKWPTKEDVRHSGESLGIPRILERPWTKTVVGPEKSKMSRKTVDYS